MLSPFATKSDPGDYSGERLINYWAQPADGATRAATLGRSGLTEFANVGQPVQKIIQMGGSLYAITNGAIYRFIRGVATLIGSRTTDTRRAILLAAVMTLLGSIAAIWIGAELGAEYGVTDVSGETPLSHRAFFGEPTTFGDAVVE